MPPSTVVPSWFQRWLTAGLLVLVGVFAASLYTSLGDNTSRIVELEKSTAVYKTQLGNIEGSLSRIETLMTRHIERDKP